MAVVDALARLAWAATRRVSLREPSRGLLGAGLWRRLLARRPAKRPAKAASSTPRRWMGASVPARCAWPRSSSSPARRPRARMAPGTSLPLMRSSRSCRTPISPVAWTPGRSSRSSGRWPRPFPRGISPAGPSSMIARVRRGLRRGERLMRIEASSVVEPGSNVALMLRALQHGVRPLQRRERAPGARGAERRGALEHVRQTAHAGVRAIRMTGGEPMIRGRTLLRLLRECRRLGVRTSTSTNGFWGREPRAARRHLRALQRRGCRPSR